MELDADDAAAAPPPPNLTAGAASMISEDQALGQAGHDYGPGEGIVMQVVGIARLKYSVPDSWKPLSLDNEDCRDDSRELFKRGKAIRYSDGGARSWRDDTPYRLQLSDGEHSIVGKFYPESTRMIRKHQKKGYPNLEVHQLVEQGLLKEGAIIRFYPCSHVESGSGMVTIFSMKVDGWSEVIGAPQPCHEGVPSFSPRDMHHCTVPAALSHVEEKPPIDWPVALLAKTIQKTCGYCAVSGSAALTEYLDSLPGCQHCYGRCYGQTISELCARGDFSNDIDLFVPEWPEAIAHFYESQGSKTPPEEHGGRGPGFNVERLEEDILPNLFKDYNIRHTKITTTAVCLSKFNDVHPYVNVDTDERDESITFDYGWMRIFVGLKFKHEFHLISSTGQLLSSKPIQILVLDAFPDSPSQPWSDMVIESFDADVIKCLAHVDPESETRIKNITFSEGALENLSAGRFEYTMRPCHSFPQMLKRITKYKERGFELQKFSFDARVSKEWREHILLQFHLMYANVWVSEWVNALGVELPTDIVGGHIAPFLECRTEEELQDEARGMLRRNILAELERSNWHDPGHNKIRRQSLFLMWRHIDWERNGKEGDIPEHITTEHIYGLGGIFIDSSSESSEESSMASSFEAIAVASSSDEEDEDL